MRVVAADVEEEALTESVREIEARGADVLAVPVDVSSASDVDALADRAFDRFAAVHLLCANAGVFQGGVSWQRTLADWEWVLGVNLWGVLHCIRAFVPRMLDGGDDGHVVTTSSLAGLLTVAYSGPYVTSKFAALALTECLAHDLASQGAPIGVSVLVPGPVDTRIADADRNRPGEPLPETQAPDADFVADMLRDITRRAGRPPDDVADLVFDAVRAGRFYVTTTDAAEAMLRERFDAVLAGRLPPSAQFDPTV
jgi:NAD(P)-dependent dehydrogenase (short-subunit alcohol dehydrogenase family)